MIIVVGCLLVINNGIKIQWLFLVSQPTLVTITCYFPIQFEYWVQMTMGLESVYDGYEYMRMQGYAYLSLTGFTAPIDSIMGIKRFIAMGY